MNPADAASLNARANGTASNAAANAASTNAAANAASTNAAANAAGTNAVENGVRTNALEHAAAQNAAANSRGTNAGTNAVANDAIYEVFAQHAQDGETVLVGSVRAPDAALALQFAREIYYRRARCERLAVVLRTDITWSEEAELTERNRNRAYRTPAYFVRARRERRAADPRHPELVEGRPRSAEPVEARLPSDTAATAGAAR